MGDFKKMKEQKASGLNGDVVKIVKYSDGSTTERLLRIFNGRMGIGTVPKGL